jgi:hypothetical protein
MFQLNSEVLRLIKLYPALNAIKVHGRLYHGKNKHGDWARDKIRTDWPQQILFVIWTGLVPDLFGRKRKRAITGSSHEAASRQKPLMAVRVE